MKILITGANGFIASEYVARKTPSQDIFLHVRTTEAAKRLLGTGWQVLIGKEGLAHIPHVDAVVHLAGKPGGNWKDCMESNILPTIAILRVMEAKQIPHLVFLSSGSVYGDAPDITKEEAPYNPINAYGASKVAAEVIISEWAAEKRIASATILRGNNIYGSGSDHGVVSLFLDRIRKNEPIEVDGDGSQIREPVFVGDVVTMIHAALAKLPNGVAVYNVSGSEYFTLKELAQQIAKALGKPLQLKFSGKSAAPPHTMRLDTAKARREFDWIARTTLAEGLAEII